MHTDVAVPTDPLSCLFFGSWFMQILSFRVVCLLLTICRHHGSEVVKVAFLSQRFKKKGFFLTVTKDGVLQFWSETFLMMNSFRVSGTLSWGWWRASVVAP